MNEILAIRDLTLEFRSRRGVVKALDGVGLALRERRFLAWWGNPDCGKTVTGLSILGLLPRARRRSTGGRSSSRDVICSPKGRMSSRSYAAARYRWSSRTPGLAEPRVHRRRADTSGHPGAHGLSKREGRRERVKRLRATDCRPSDSLLESYPHQLSGGMRQRVCMAMAISCGARLLIADEPTTALDVTIQAQILLLLLRLRDEHGLAQILITHNVAVAAQSCDRLAVMYAGTVVEEGRPRTS